MEGPGRRVYPIWCGASPQRRELPAHYELALRNPGGDCGRVLRLDVEEDRLDLSLRAAPCRRGHLLALLLPRRVEARLSRHAKIWRGKLAGTNSADDAGERAGSSGVEFLRDASGEEGFAPGSDCVPHG